MPGKHNGGGCKCCNPPCSVADCNCVNSEGKNQCFPVMQIKVDGIEPGTVAGNDFGCSTCDSEEGTWYQYTCETDALSSSQPIGITGETYKWFLASTVSVIDPCTGLPITRRVWIKLTRSGTTVTVTVQIESSSGGNQSYARFEITFTLTTAGDCPDYSNKSTQSMTRTTTSGTDPCDYSNSTGSFRWV